MKTKIKILFTMFILFIMVFSTKTLAASNSVEGWYKATASYNMREEKNKNAKVIANIPKNTTLYVERKDKYNSKRVIVEYNGKKGSIAFTEALVKTTEPKKSSNKDSEEKNKKKNNTSKENVEKKDYYKNKYPLVMRKDGVISGKGIITIPANSTIYVTGKDSKVSNRVIVKYKNKTGSVLNYGLVKNSTKTYEEEYKYYARINAKCSLYNSKGKEIKKIEKNELIKVISLTSNKKNYYEVDWYGTTGLLHKKYIEKKDNAIFVSISKQKETLIRDGILVIQTPVVTGKLNKSDTPKGAFSIQSKKCATKDNPVYLTGPGYKSQVDYWMRVYNGVGIHDANRWRSKYGGNIYKTSGSHGCINTPLKAMKVIYENSYVKMPVYIQ